MLSTSLRTLRARYQGCIAVCSDSVWAAHAALQNTEQGRHDELASMPRYATLAATLACHQHLTRPYNDFGHAHRTFFSWGTKAKPAVADAVLDDTTTGQAAEAAAAPDQVLDVLQIIDVAAMSETHALQAAAESAWPNTVAAQYLIELMHSGAGLGWCVAPMKHCVSVVRVMHTHLAQG